MRNLTFMVSRGWPATTVHTPPNPPLKKYLMGLTLSDMIAVLQLITRNIKYWIRNDNSKTHPTSHEGSKYINQESIGPWLTLDVSGWWISINLARDVFHGVSHNLIYTSVFCVAMTFQYSWKRFARKYVYIRIGEHPFIANMAMSRAALQV